MARTTTLHAVRQKSLGAFYTRESLAEAIIRWGLRTPRRAVLDPSCGDGRFLAPAAREGVLRVVGCDVDPEALEQSRRRLSADGSRATLLQGDFFTLDPADHPGFDLVVGNPPFIRYQRFTGDSRRRALQSALQVGVRLTGLTSSWAPFLIHAMRFVATGGDLAMVVPAEILQTQYGLPTLRAMTDNFESVSLLVSENNYFREVVEETAILLARGRGGRSIGARLVSARDLEEVLEHIESNARSTAPSAGVLISAQPRARYSEALLLPSQREAWKKIISAPGVAELGELGKLTNGYVSGDNGFFHRTLVEAAESGLPSTWLRRCARSSKSLRGLAFTAGDLAGLEADGVAHHLVVPQDDLFSGRGQARTGWLQEGEQRGTPDRYKCRVRTPWWLVPGLLDADVLVAYMNGAHPRAAFNETRALYTNSLHGLRLRTGPQGQVVAFAMHSSLTLLSLEIEGRSYGGGMLKLEPTEMRHARIVLPTTLSASVRKAMAETDTLLRSDRYEQAVTVVDRVLLVGELGLTAQCANELAQARILLRGRRMGRARKETLPGITGVRAPKTTLDKLVG